MGGFKRERKRHQSRILSLLIQQGIYETNPSRKSFLGELEEMRTWGGKKLSGDLKERLIREYERLQKVEEPNKRNDEMQSSSKGEIRRKNQKASPRAQGTRLSLKSLTLYVLILTRL